MDMNALNSLAEVGVGINLAFGLIQGVRQRLVPLLGKKLDTKKENIKALLSDYVSKNGDGNNSEIVVNLDDVSSCFMRRVQKTERLFIVGALSVAFILVYFLYESSFLAADKINPVWSDIMLTLVLAPLVLNYFLQGFFYWRAQRSLEKRETQYEDAVKLMDSSIKPKNPD